LFIQNNNLTLHQNSKDMTHFQIKKQLDLRLIRMGKTKAELARAMGISQQLLWNYCKGMYKSVTPEKLEEMLNDGIKKL
jgi:transcriptional regulator with XRE-family HTH domain